MIQVCNTKLRKTHWDNIYSDYVQGQQSTCKHSSWHAWIHQIRELHQLECEGERNLNERQSGMKFTTCQSTCPSMSSHKFTEVSCKRVWDISLFVMIHFSRFFVTGVHHLNNGWIYKKLTERMYCSVRSGYYRIGYRLGVIGYSNVLRPNIKGVLSSQYWRSMLLERKIARNNNKIIGFNAWQ